MNIMNFLINRYPNAKTDITTAVPDKGTKLFVFIILSHFTKILRLNLLFLIVSLPVLTAPAAFSAMTYVFNRLIRDGYCHIWNDFWKEFRNGFSRCLALAAFWSLVLGVSFYGIFLLRASISWFAAISYVLLIITNMLAYLIMAYALSLNAQVNLSFKSLITDAIILVFADYKKALLMSAICGVFLFLTLFVPYTILLHVFFLFALLSLANYIVTKETIEKYILIEYH